ncbi:hypothetical protein HDU92_007354 [Lobulomyces angularis]|nr:hypothetical protein HDU92_007354 [Lobulomyces angularis]
MGVLSSILALIFLAGFIRIYTDITSFYVKLLLSVVFGISTILIRLIVPTLLFDYVLKDIYIFNDEIRPFSIFYIEIMTEILNQMLFPFIYDRVFFFLFALSRGLSIIIGGMWVFKPYTNWMMSNPFPQDPTSQTGLLKKCYKLTFPKKSRVNPITDNDEETCTKTLSDGETNNVENKNETSIFDEKRLKNEADYFFFRVWAQINASTTQNWLLWMLSDSALPTGGFVQSSGLEASIKLSLVKDEKDLILFVKNSLHSLLNSTFYFVAKLYFFYTIDIKNNIGLIVDLSNEYDSTISNHVSRRASNNQGSAVLTLLIKGINPTNEIHKAVLDEFKSLVRQRKVSSHLPIAFALACIFLDISLKNCIDLQLFLHTRQIISSAIRLNLIGPYRGQKLILDFNNYCCTIIDNFLQLNYQVSSLDLIDKSKFLDTKNLDDSIMFNNNVQYYQTSPLQDIIQGTHDRLYSRLFNS